MTQKTLNISPPKTIGVKKIPTNDLEPNPHNPRLLFDKRPLEILENSIRKVGILVPLTVYQDSKTRKYVILDGQRRWICAQNIGLETVPANEVEQPDEVQNIVTMFQIHKFREDWELMPTALKLEVLMKKLEEQSDKILAELTGLDASVVSRCKKLLKFPPNYQEMMLFIDPKDRIKADFFIELYPIISDVAVRKMRGISRNYIIDKMLWKYQNKVSGLKAVTDFRKIKQHFVNARRINKISWLGSVFKEFLESDELTIDHLEVAGASTHAKATKLTQDIGKLISEIENIDARVFFGEEGLWLGLEELVRIAQKKLLQAERRPQ